MPRCEHAAELLLHNTRRVHQKLVLQQKEEHPRTTSVGGCSKGSDAVAICLAVAASENGQECDEISVVWEEAIVVEVDVAAERIVATRAACKHAEEINKVGIVGEEPVIVEVNRIARHNIRCECDVEIAWASGAEVAACAKLVR